MHLYVSHDQFAESEKVPRDSPYRETYCRFYLKFFEWEVVHPAHLSKSLSDKAVHVENVGYWVLVRISVLGMNYFILMIFLILTWLVTPDGTPVSFLCGDTSFDKQHACWCFIVVMSMTWLCILEVWEHFSSSLTID
jgi:hypothetical protein